MNRNKNGKQATKNAAKQANQRTMASAPVAQVRLFKQSNPVFTSLANGGSRIRHREYIADISGSVAFASTSFSINPGLSTMFPWLSGRAQGYETYHFNSLKWSYETEAATSKTGAVLLVQDPDAADAAPLSKSDAMTYQVKNRGAPWQPFDLSSLRMSDASGMSRKFIRRGALAANLDIKTYDAGNLFVCTIGQADTSVIGELYVEYDVSLYDPQIIAGSSQAASIAVSAGATGSALFGTTRVATGDLPYTQTSSSTITFNAQCELLVIARIAGTVLSGNLANAGTCTFTAMTAEYNGAATSGNAFCIIRASPGDTFIPSITATTVTTVAWRMGAYTYSLG